MTQYHRNVLAGTRTISTGDSFTFRSLRDDLADLRANAPAGLVGAGVTSIGTSERGEPIHAIRFGKNAGAPVLLAGCHHAREWLSVEVPFLAAKFLLEHYATDARVRRLVDSLDLWVVPMVNPDGHEHSVLVDRLWRKNMPPTGSGRASVDLNRNYDTSTWGGARGAFSTNASSDSFRGPSAGFAREVQEMQTLITTRGFRGSLDYHTFGRFVLFPFAGRPAPHPDADQQAMGAHVERVVDLQGTDYVLLQASAFYPTLWGVAPPDGVVPGGLMDFVVEKVPDSIAVTVELEPDQSDPRGFVMPESAIDTTFDLHRASILTFLNCIGTMKHPPSTRALTISAGTTNDFAVFNPDCSVVFERA